MLLVVPGLGRFVQVQATCTNFSIYMASISFPSSIFNTMSSALQNLLFFLCLKLSLWILYRQPEFSIFNVEIMVFFLRLFPVLKLVSLQSFWTLANFPTWKYSHYLWLLTPSFIYAVSLCVIWILSLPCQTLVQVIFPQLD